MDALLARAMTQAKIGAWACDLEDDRLSWTAGVYELFGLPTDAVPTRDQAIAMYADESRQALEEARSEAIRTGGSFSVDAQIMRADGARRWVRITGEVVQRPGRAPVLHGLKRDVTEEKRQEHALRRLAERDPLTGLESRAVYETRFLNPPCASASIGPVGALILFDLDDFKLTNDRFGHLAGDACLQHFAQRLRAAFPDALLAARIGGDEFAVIVDDAEPPAAIEHRVARLLGDLDRPFRWRGHRLRVAATSGLAVPSDPLACRAADLFDRADAALYAAKRARPRDTAAREAGYAARAARSAVNSTSSRFTAWTKLLGAMSISPVQRMSGKRANIWR